VLLKKLLKNKLSVLGLVISGIIIIMALFAPVFAPYSPNQIDLAHRLSKPSANHFLGQDSLGRDIFSRIIYGSRISVWVGFSTVILATLFGFTFGALAGYYGGWIDGLIMRLVDVLMAFPGILLAIALMAVLGPSLNNVILTLCLIGWVGYARLVRGQILFLRETEFVTAAKALGLGPVRIIFGHILPNVLGPLMVQATFGMAGNIVAEAGLSFLGLGVQPPTPSWGAMLNEGRAVLLSNSNLTTFPGLAIMIMVLGFNFIGDGLRDAVDPKLKIY
jgi:peptide/nickel transport system permease protein